MTKDNINSKKGFTIIEVVLVLAIAGLIFLMVFVALPALQRSQRDTQRRQDYADLQAAIETYATNNNGRLPNPGNLNAQQYVNSTGADPNGVGYTVTVMTAGNYTDDTVPTEGQIFVVTGANCSGQNGTTGNAEPAAVENRTRAFAVFGYLETGNSYCRSNTENVNNE